MSLSHTQNIPAHGKTSYSFSGDINESISLGDIVQTLVNKKREGKLRITTDDAGETVVCIQGNNIGLLLSPTLRLDHITEKLYWRGQISKEIYDETQGKKIQDALAILKEEAGDACRLTMEIICYDELCKIINYKKGKFQFSQENTANDPLMGELVPAEVVLMEAARRQDEWPKIQEILPPENEMLIHQQENPEGLVQAQRHQPMGNIWQLAHRRTVKNILNCAGVSEFEASKILASFISKKYVRLISNDELSSYAEELESKQEISHAKECYELLLQRKANDPVIAEKIALFYQKAGNNMAAAELYQFLANVFVNSPDVDKQRQAAAYLKKIGELLPNSPESIGSRLQLFQIITQNKVVDFNRDYNSIDEGKKLFRALRANGSHQQALSVLNIVLSMQPDDIPLLQEAFELGLEMKDLPQAIACCQQLARLWEKRGRLRKAHDCYRKILDLDPNQDQAQLHLQTLQRQKKQRLFVTSSLIILISLAFAIYEWVSAEQQEQQKIMRLLNRLDSDIQQDRWSEVAQQWGAIPEQAKKKMANRVFAVEKQIQQHIQRLCAKAADEEKQGDLQIAQKLLQQATAFMPLSVEMPEVSLRLQRVTETINSFYSMLQTARQYESEKNYAKAIENYLAIWNNVQFKKLPEYGSISLPVLFSVKPVGVSVKVDGKDFNRLKQPQETLSLPPDFATLQLEFPGYQTNNYYNAFYAVSDKIVFNKKGEKLYPLSGDLQALLEKSVHSFFSLTDTAEGEMFHDDNSLFIACRDGYVHGFTPDLRLKWSLQIKESAGIAGGPFVHKGTLYIGTKDGKLYAIRTPSTENESTNFIAKATLDGHLLAGSISGTQGTIVCMDDRGNIYAFPALDKTTNDWNYLWQYACEQKNCLPVLAEDKLVVTDKSNHLLLLDARSGNIIWRHPILYPVYSIVCSNSTAYLGCDEFVCAINLKNKVEIWNTKIVGNVVGKVILSDNAVYFATSKQQLYSVDSQNGKILWELALNAGTLRTSPAVSNKMMYLTCQKGWLYAVQNGELLWKYKTEGQHISSPLLIGNLVFVAARKVYSFLNN